MEKKIYDGARYVTVFGSEKHGAIYKRIRYLISQKSGITYIFLTILRKSKLILMIQKIDLACFNSH